MLRFYQEALKIQLLVLLLYVTPCGSVIGGLSSGCGLEIVPAHEEYEYVQDGDVIIGGIFSVNRLWTQKEKSAKQSVQPMLCIRPLSQFYRSLQLFLFTIDEMNRDPILLPNLTLGYHIYDSCSDPRKAIKSVLQMISGPGATVPNYSCKENWRLAGFVGDQSSTTTLPIAYLLSVYKFPLISYGATDHFLGHRRIFPSFFRTIESDFKLFGFLTDLIKKFGWTWVGIITSNDEGGERESSSLTVFLNAHEICVAFILRNSFTGPQTRGSNFQKEMKIVQKLSVQVIILCGTYHDLIFESSLSKWLNNVTMILTPTWGPNVVLIEKYPEIFNGSLSLDPTSDGNEELRQFMDKFYPVNRPKDILLENLWMTAFQCLSGKEEKDKLYEEMYGMRLKNCTGLERIKDSYQYVSKLQYIFNPVFNAVYFLTNAIHWGILSQNLWTKNLGSYRNKVNNGKSYTPCSMPQALCFSTSHICHDCAMYISEPYLQLSLPGAKAGVLLGS